jgi:3-(3-hydroxy-phenyl)propionate hydroxylase
MGSRLEDISFAADWLVVDLVPHDPAACTNELIQLCDPRRPTTAVSGGPRRRRFEFMMLEGERKEEFNNAPAAWELLKPWGWGPQNALLERHAVYTFRAAIADRWRLGRLMIAGDAAHLTPPFAAQGLCAGLRDMASLSWRLDMVLRERASDALLEDYTSERRMHAKVLVEFAVELGKVICLLDPQAAAGRDRALLSADKREPEKMPEPRLGPSSLIMAGDSAAGLLSIQGRVRHFGREGRFDDFMGHRFLLLGNGYNPETRLNDRQRAFLMSIGASCAGIGVHCDIQDINGSYRQWFEMLNTDAVLVRPDFYMLGSGDPAALVEHLMSAWTPFAPTAEVS